MKATIAAIFLLFLPLALAAGPAAIATASLDASASAPSQQVFGSSTVFTCVYSDLHGNAVQGSACSVIVDGRSNMAIPAGGSNSYGELLSIGQHSWYCSCSAPGYEAKESDPRGIDVLPPAASDLLKSEASSAIGQASQALSDAKQSGADTGNAEAQLNAAKSALDKGDYKLANALASSPMFGDSFNSRDRITNMSLLLIPTLFFGVLVVVVLFILLRK
jgi:hypothetical protein